MFDVVIGTTIIVAGVLVGVEFCVAVFINPILDRLPDNGGLAARSDGARLLGAVMPFWYFATLVLSIITTAMAWSSPGAVLSGIAAALVAATIILAVTVLVPINNRVKKWSTGEHPADWRTQVRRWDRWHYLRVGLILVGFALLVVTALIPAT